MSYSLQQNVLCLLFLLLPLSFFAQNLQADFSHQSLTDSFCQNISVQFNDLSTGNPTSWEWDFGDSTGISSFQNGPHNYNWGGFRTVTLIISDGFSYDTLQKQIFINSPSFDATYTIIPFQPPNTRCEYIIQADQTNMLHNWCTGDFAPSIYVKAPIECIVQANSLDGCVDFDTLRIGIVLARADITPATCHGVPDGSIVLTPVPGKKHVRFLWQNGDTTAYQYNLLPGFYQVLITDSAAECNKTYTYRVGEIGLGLQLQTGFTDCDSMNGPASIVPTRGTAPYTYLWSNGETSNIANSLSWGGFSVAVTDSSGCINHKTGRLQLADSCYATVQGDLFFDADRSCDSTVGDHPLMGWVLFRPEDSSRRRYDTRGSNMGSTYKVRVKKGRYYVTFHICGFLNTVFFCPKSRGYWVNIESDTMDVDGVFNADSVLDLRIRACMREQFSFGRVKKYAVQIRAVNEGGTAEKPQVRWRYDPKMIINGFNSTSSNWPSPTVWDSVNREVVWDLDTLNPILNEFVNIGFSLDPSWQIGDTLVNEAFIFPDTNDVNPTNNYWKESRILWEDHVGSVKRVNPIGKINKGFISPLQPYLAYQIQFKNNTSDTAFFVTIRDTLSPAFRSQNLLPGEGSHPFSMHIEQDSILIIEFENIQLLDSAHSDYLSRGYVGFEVALKDNLSPGTQIKNRAWVSFNFGPSQPTSMTLNTIYEGGIIDNIDSDNKNIVSMYPNPGHNQLEINSAVPLEKIEMFNLNGKKMTIKVIEKDSRRFSLQLNELPEGIYLIKLHKQKGVSFHKWIKF